MRKNSWKIFFHQKIWHLSFYMTQFRRIQHALRKVWYIQRYFDSKFVSHGTRSWIDTYRNILPFHRKYPYKSTARGENGSRTWVIFRDLFTIFFLYITYNHQIICTRVVNILLVLSPCTIQYYVLDATPYDQ